MAQMHGSPLFVGIENVKGVFVLDVAPVHEIEHPFRSCNHAWYIHVWPGKALVLGWWKKRHTEEQNLLMAVQGRNLDVQEENTIGIFREPVPGVEKKADADEFS